MRGLRRSNSPSANGLTGRRSSQTGPEPTPALAAGLAGMPRGHAEIGGAGRQRRDDGTAVRAEGPDVAGLFAGLAAALFDEIDHEAYDVRAVQFDGMVRTDEGLAGWGYAWRCRAVDRVGGDG